MRSFWIWFLFLLLSWSLAFVQAVGETDTATTVWRLGSSAIFFTAYFLSSLYKNIPSLLCFTLCVTSIFAAISLWPNQGDELNLYSLLVYSILAGEAVFRLPGKQAVLAGAVLAMGALAPAFLGHTSFPTPFVLLYVIFLGSGLLWFRKLWNRWEETAIRNESLLSEYRNMKRRLIADEENARREERAQVGRDIHDSVGHKLTALLMQLEVHRMQADDRTEPVLRNLKELAKESLEETRQAVKSLRIHETGGLAAIMSLLRRLEAESFMRVNFTLRHGALSAPLSNVQSIAVFRAVQEAMTNAMKHGSAREAQIMFEAPGGGLFRFEVDNPHHKGKESAREGYGLRSMRERIEQAGGTLEVIHYETRFMVRGTFHLTKPEEEVS